MEEKKKGPKHNGKSKEKAKAELKKMDFSAEKMEEMLSQGYVPAFFDKMTVADLKEGDVLMFQWRAQLDPRARKQASDQFIAWFAQNLGVKCVFIPVGIDLNGIMRQAPEFLEKLGKEYAEKQAQEAAEDPHKGEKATHGTEPEVQAPSH